MSATHTHKPIWLHNTLTRAREEFVPLHPPLVGLYVCGPTVYGDPHLGHARPAVTFDLLFRLLRYEGYKVRYVRNITDVGHLENDADAGEDKIAKRARIEQLEPMEVAAYYTDRYHQSLDRLGVLRPSIEPLASGHIIEQIELVRAILEAGYAYLNNGSVYFDVRKYVENGGTYGRLSGRNLDDLMSGGRSDDFRDEKRFAADFALWKRAEPQHIMRWPSPWGEGFPGWHIECSAMSKKYLGEEFDIHGGGMDLVFPHHECEMAQSNAAFSGARLFSDDHHGSCGCGDHSSTHASARYWVHNNMVTIGGQKMGKSLGNFITLEQFFTGEHPLLTRAYSPMTIRFFILQAHYRSTLDFSDQALGAAEKGLDKLMGAWNLLRQGKIEGSSSSEVVSVLPVGVLEGCVEGLRDDLNSPVVLAKLFGFARMVYGAYNGELVLTVNDVGVLREVFDTVLGTLLGLSPVVSDLAGNEQDRVRLDGVMELVLDMRQGAKEAKDWPLSDKIRDRLSELGIRVKDRKEGGADWEIL